MDASARQQLEARLRLSDGEHLEGSTWRYDLLDPSQDAIRAIVRDKAVADTHHIDRSRFALDSAERTARRGRIAYGGALVTTADGMAVALAAFAALLTAVALSRTMIPTVAPWAAGHNRLLRLEGRLTPYALLTVLGVAVYAAALWFPPTNGDDIAYLSSVATTGNPFSYFIQDHGHDNELYRPLTAASMWFVYQAFGVWALPNQIINLVLHLANVFLLYRIIEREGSDKAVAFLAAAVFMISKYTWLASTWVSDRPMVLTGLFLLLLVNHLSQHAEPSGSTSAAPVRLFAVAAFSVLALMSKESGLVVPTVGLLFALMPWGAPHLDPRHRVNLAVVTVSIVGLYLLFRVLIFGPNFASYSQDGYMFLGSVHYEDSDDLPQHLRYLSYAENVTKNVLAPVLHVFADTGSLLSWRSVLIYSPVIVSTALLFALAARRHLSRLQWVSLMIILANAVAHFAMFRFRLHYLSHAAFCLFVASSPFLGDSQDHGGRKLAAKALATTVLVGGILWTSYMLDVYTLDRNRTLATLRTDSTLERHKHVVDQVLLMYGGF